MDANDLAQAITDLFELAEEEAIEDTDLGDAQMRSFADAGVMTRDAGIVVVLRDGSEFQVTVVRSR